MRFEVPSGQCSRRNGLVSISADVRMFHQSVLRRTLSLWSRFNLFVNQILSLGQGWTLFVNLRPGVWVIVCVLVLGGAIQGAGLLITYQLALPWISLGPQHRVCGVSLFRCAHSSRSTEYILLRTNELRGS